MSLLRSFSRLGINLKPNKSWRKKIPTNWLGISNVPNINRNEIHTSSTTQDLMEFFDNKENWTEREVRVGRSWRLEELRIKSNSDLHKLWYVLLKEKNMLLTMEHEYHRNDKELPNPERIDKVEESMENIETVVRERNRAYFELETGETGERPHGVSTNCFGLEYKYKMSEYPIEARFNKKYKEDQKLYNYTEDHEYIKDFLTRLEEKRQRIANYNKRRNFSLVCKILETFPNVDEEALKEKFPDVDIQAAKEDKRSRGHRVNQY